MGKLKTRGLWCGASEAGKTPQSVDEYVERMHDAGFNLILPNLKQGHGRVTWPSEKFPERIAEGYERFDLPKYLLESCRKRDVEVHAWFIDFMDSPDHPHPEWAMRDRNGEPTDAEVLRGNKFPFRWMCPAQRPGYTDQWLVPMYREFAERYDFDAVHHDYVRYPGDLAPDQYCFCDSCLDEIPRWARLVTDAMPERAFEHPMYDREYLEAHWEPSPRVLPGDWSDMSRQEKSDFLLEGRFFEDGRRDLDYFFYEYRINWINEFVRECAAAVRDVRPGMKISAAVFKNPIHSGRFIGQDWRRHAQYVDVAMPMDYRDHFPGSFDDYLVLLAETIDDQKVWARNFREYYPGAAINFMFWEEELPLKALALAAEIGDRKNATGFYHCISSRLSKVDPDLSDTVAKWIGLGGGYDLRDAQRYLSHRRSDFFDVVEGAPAGFATELRVFAEDPPKEYWPHEKFERLVETVEQSGVDGMVVFCEGHLHQYGLWETAKSIFT
ncbi:MAG TPA: putative glycoside hydrolase [Fimbriimonadaceae bacterium]|nr:putative glycoside hydrolase [Fimbriimonadaceae bacterium]